MKEKICPNCEDCLMSIKEDLLYNYVSFQFLQCSNCGHEEYE